MNLLNKLTIKNLILNKKRTIVTIMGIILSVALITAVSSMYASGISSLINFEINRSGNYHAHFKNVPASSLATFKNNLGVSKILITKDLGYASINSENPDKPYAFIKAYTKDSLDNLSVNLTEGRLPENESEIIIPSSLGGYIVSSIGEKAFFGKIMMTSVIMPEGITYIGNNAFSGCLMLESVKIPETVTYLGNGCFTSCSELESVILNNSISSIFSKIFNKQSSSTSKFITSSYKSK